MAFLPGLTWGLPSRDADAFLFGDRTPWTGEEIVALLGEFDAGAGSADADTVASNENEIINDTDRERAEIVARYRLYSYQPDEMLTFRALATAAANRGDPQFYTYGGLFVYPVGVLIKLFQIAGLIDPGGQAFYLDHPEEFARFYIVARLYSVAWAAIGAAVVCVLVRRVTRSNLLGVVAAVTYAFLPVVVVGAHEAKPHLPGAVLALWSVLPAESFVRRGRRRSLLWSGVLCGLATGMVVTMAVSFLILPTAALLRWRRGVSRPASRGASGSSATNPEAPRKAGRLTPTLISATLLGIAAFALTNPYLILNLLTNPAAIAGNAGQTAGHYEISVAGLPQAAAYFDQASFPTGTFLFIVLSVATLFMAGRFVAAASRSRRSRDRALFRMLGSLVLISLPAAAAFGAYLVTAADRPPDHVRFALLAAATLPVLLLTALPLGLRVHGRLPEQLLLVLPLIVALSGVFVIRRYRSDMHSNTSRFAAAELLQASGSGHLTLWAAPAPAFVPAFDLWRFEARVTDREFADVRMTRESEASISWANRQFELPTFDDSELEK